MRELARVLDTGGVLRFSTIIFDPTGTWDDSALVDAVLAGKPTLSHYARSLELAGLELQSTVAQPSVLRQGQADAGVKTVVITATRSRI